MAKEQLLGAVERRRMCQDGSAGLKSAGQAYLDTGRWGEALECFEALKDLDGAAMLASLAIEAGDVFYYKQAKRLLGQEASINDLKQLAQKAVEMGKNAFASTAEQLISHEESDQ
jgi:NTP pyrophosphatase (non-canonical NTP hydrolase)